LHKIIEDEKNNWDFKFIDYDIEFV